MKIFKNVVKVILVLAFGATTFIAGYNLSNVRFDHVKDVEKQLVGYKITIETKDILGKVVNTKSYFTTNKEEF